MPLFAAALERDGRAAARSFAEDVLTVLLWALLILVIAAQIVMPWLMHVLAPGFADEPEKLDLTVQLTRLTFPYILLISARLPPRRGAEFSLSASPPSRPRRSC